MFKKPLRILIEGEDYRIWALIHKKATNAESVHEVALTILNAWLDSQPAEGTETVLTGEALTLDGWQALLWPVPEGG